MKIISSVLRLWYEWKGNRKPCITTLTKPSGVARLVYKFKKLLSYVIRAREIQEKIMRIAQD